MDIYCERCQGEIQEREDLVTVMYWTAVVPFHNDCYAKTRKTWQVLATGNYPINSWGGNLSAAFGLLLIAIAMLMPSGLGVVRWMMGLVGVVPIVLRVYSWLRYERHLLTEKFR